MTGKNVACNVRLPRLISGELRIADAEKIVGRAV
jgi:hypothetical protein